MRIRVKVNPGSKSEGVRLLEEGFYQVRTRAPAHRGKANRRVLVLLAEELGCDVDQIDIVAGATQPVKIVRVRSNQTGSTARAKRIARTKPHGPHSR